MVAQQMPKECSAGSCNSAFTLETDTVEIGLPENPLTLLGELNEGIDRYEVDAYFKDRFNQRSLYNATLEVYYVGQCIQFHADGSASFPYVYSMSEIESSFSGVKNLSFEKIYQWGTKKPYY